MGAVDAVEWACVLCGHCIQNNRVEQRIYIRFCVKLGHSSTETIQTIQRAAATGNWWLAALSWHVHSCITSRAEIFWATSNHPGDSAPLQPRYGTLQLLAFPKTKITFERVEISDHWWDSGKYNKAADGNWENCVRSQGAYFEGDGGVIVLCTVFLVSCIYFNKYLWFSYYMAGYFLDTPHIFYSNFQMCHTLFIFSFLFNLVFYLCSLCFHIGLYHHL